MHRHKKKEIIPDFDDHGSTIPWQLRGDVERAKLGALELSKEPGALFGLVEREEDRNDEFRGS